MIALASLLLPIAAGWVWCSSLHLRFGKGAMAIALQGGLAIGLGFGVSSTLFFLLNLAGLANVGVIALCEIVWLAGGLFAMRRSFVEKDETKETAEPQPSPERTWRWSGVHYGLAAAAVLMACLAGAIAANAYSAAPHGRWDAWAIWNLRAKYVAGDHTWSNAVSPLLAETHPEYPLGTPSLIARTWVYGGRDFDPSVPAGIAGLYALATLLVVIGGLGVTRGPTVGLLAGCVLLSAQSWVGEVGAQYADIPLGLYFVAALTLLALALDDEGDATPNTRHASTRAAIQAGVFAAFAAFTKNEGLAFVAALVLAILLTSTGRRQLRGFALGLAPGLVLAVLFKFFIAAHDPEVAQSVGAMVSKAATFSRWGSIFSVFGARLLTLGEWYAHPVVLAVAVWFVFRSAATPAASENPTAGFLQQVLPLWIAAALMMAMYFGAYLITPADLNWQLDTSMDRLLVQMLPAVLVSLLLATAMEQTEPLDLSVPAEATVRNTSTRKSRKKAEPKA